MPSRKLSLALLFALAAAAVSVSPAPAAVAANSPTLADLQAALQGESNASAKYAAFATRAEEEGYGSVASLFRAASRAEKIHADNHAQVIRSMGGVPAVQVSTPVAGTTAENLRAAIQGESYERDKMYPEFLARARGAGLADAVQTFNYARTAEMEHAKLYQAALDRLDELKGSKAVTYYVCTVCGYTTTTIDFSKCPSCFNSRDKYVEVG
jgi:rubrerythrin